MDATVRTALRTVVGTTALISAAVAGQPAPAAAPTTDVECDTKSRKHGCSQATYHITGDARYPDYVQVGCTSRYAGGEWAAGGVRSYWSTNGADPGQPHHTYTPARSFSSTGCNVGGASSGTYLPTTPCGNFVSEATVLRTRAITWQRTGAVGPDDVTSWTKCRP